MDNITEGDDEWDNIIDMEQGDVPNANYHRDFLIKHFEGADSMLKSVMLKEKLMSEKEEIHGKEEFEKVLRLDIGMTKLSTTLGMPVHGVGE